MPDEGRTETNASVSAIIVTRGDVELDEPTAAILDAGIPELVVYDNGSGEVTRLRSDGTFYIESGILDVDATRESREYSTRPLPDLGVYGRYEAIKWATGDLLFVQDDDAVIEPDAIRRLIECARESDVDLETDAGWPPAIPIVANMPESRWVDYPDSCLVGWGAVFHRDLPAAAFDRFLSSSVGRSIFGVNSPDLAIGERKLQRTCDVVFTTLTPHRKIDLGFRHLPWAETPGRMFKQPNHKKERDEMLELARRIRDGG